ncbi:hypothetical protein ACHAWC_011269 [Mediolabrus comicus]
MPHRCKKPEAYLIITNISKRQNVRNLIQIGAAFGVRTIFVVGQKNFNFDVQTNDDDDDEQDHHDANSSNNNNNKSTTSDIPTAILDAVKRGKINIIRFDRLEKCVEHIKSLPCCEDAATAAEAAAVEKDKTDATVVEGADNDEYSNNDDNATEKASSSGEKSTIQILGVEIDPSSINLEQEDVFTASTAFMMGNEGQGMTTKQMSVCDGFVRISQYGGGTASLNVSVAAGLVLHRFFHWSRGDVVK